MMSDATRPPEADNGSTAPQEPIEERLARLEAWCCELEERSLAERRRIDDVADAMRGVAAALDAAGNTIRGTTREPAAVGHE